MTTIRQRYILHDLIGEGGMGAVYRATDRLTGERVALKKVTIPVDHLQFSSRGAADDYIVALSREFGILGTLRHPHIVSVLDYGFDEENLPYLTLTLLEGGKPITDIHADDPTKVRLLAQILQALVYLHRRGVLHRDLKPANVLVVGEHAYVVDFGLAVQHGEDPGEGGGTLAYMAPELIHGSHPSVASDLYALGLVAYELFMGDFPYDTSSTNEMLVNHILLTTPDLTALDPFLNEFISGLLDKDPAHRPPTALDALNRLQATCPYPLELDSVALRESFLEAATFVGREHELQQLMDAAEEMHGGQGGLWLVSGEAGVGKTRLLQELRIRELVQGVEVIQGSAAGMRLQLWRDVLPALLLHIDVSDAEAAVLRVLVPSIEQIVGRRIPDPPALQSRQAVNRLYETVLRVINRLTIPVLLIAEDLHADEANVPILQRLAPALDALPLLVVGSFRTDEAPYLAEAFPTAQTLHLERFDRAAITAFSASILGDAGKRQEVVGLLQQETEGNALFMVEVLRALAEEAGDFFRVGQVSLPEYIVTGGVQAVLQRRLALMEADDQDLLRLAAVAGRRLDVHVLEWIVGDDEALEGWLLRGSAVAVLEVQHNQWQFSHDRLRTTLLHAIEPHERAHLHQQVADAMVAVYPAQLDQLALTLTDHYREAGNTAQEVAYGLRVAQHAYLFPQPHAQRVIVRRLELQDLLDPAQLHWIRLSDLRTRLALGDPTIGAEAEALLNDADAANNISLRVGVAVLLLEWADITQQSLQLGAIAHLLKVVHDPASRASLLSALGVYHANRGRITEALPLLTEAVHLNPDSYRAHVALGNLYRQQQDYDEAIVRYEQAWHLATARGDAMGVQMTLGSLGTAYLHLNRTDDAAHIFREALSVAQSIGYIPGQGMWLAALGETALAHNDLTSAYDYLSEAVAVAARMRDAARRASRLALLASVLARMEELDRAERTMIDSLDLIEDLDAPLEYRVVCDQCAMIALRFGAVSAAAAWAKRSVHLDRSDENARAYLIWGVAALMEGQRAEAIKALAWVRDQCGGQSPPRDLIASIGLGLIGDGDYIAAMDAYVALNNYGTATEAYEQWLCLLTLAGLGNVEEALAAVEGVLG